MSQYYNEWLEKTSPELFNDDEPEYEDEPRYEKVFEYISLLEKPNKGKTRVFSCINNRHGDELGIVKWYGAWRQYCYFPTADAVYSRGCLRDIQSFIDYLTTGRKMENKA